MNQLYNFFKNTTTLEFDRQKLELFTVTLPEDSIIYDIYEWLQKANMTLPVVSFMFTSMGFYGLFYGAYKHIQYRNMIYYFDRERLLTQYIINKSDSGSDYAPSSDNASEDNASEDIDMSSDEPEDLMDPRTATKRTVQDFENDLLSFERTLRKKKQD
jgi:hypothetical protein